jgi:hypothetical protein
MAGPELAEPGPLAGHTRGGSSRGGIARGASESGRGRPWCAGAPAPRPRRICGALRAHALERTASARALGGGAAGARRSARRGWMRAGPAALCARLGAGCCFGVSADTGAAGRCPTNRASGSETGGHGGRGGTDPPPSCGAMTAWPRPNAYWYTPGLSSPSRMRQCSPTLSGPHARALREQADAPGLRAGLVPGAGRRVRGRHLGT